MSGHDFTDAGCEQHDSHAADSHQIARDGVGWMVHAWVDPCQRDNHGSHGSQRPCQRSPRPVWRQKRHGESNGEVQRERRCRVTRRKAGIDPQVFREMDSRTPAMYNSVAAMYTVSSSTTLNTTQLPAATSV